MAAETGQIRRNIASTREEIDRHLEELTGQVRSELDIERRASRNLPQVLIGTALAGLFLGILVGHGRGYQRRLLERESRLPKERERLAKGATIPAKFEMKGLDIP